MLADGSWFVGDQPAAHDLALRYLKARLVFQGEGAFVVDGARRLPVRVEGPPFEVLRIALDPVRGEARALLDDGSEETLRDGSLWMDEASGRFECAARSGVTRAFFSRAAHQTLLANAEEEDGQFYLRVGPRRVSIRA